MKSDLIAHYWSLVSVNDRAAQKNVNAFERIFLNYLAVNEFVSAREGILCVGINFGHFSLTNFGDYLGIFLNPALAEAHEANLSVSRESNLFTRREGYDTWCLQVPVGQAECCAFIMARLWRSDELPEGELEMLLA